ncbi:Major intrinsic protein [Corchorus capsularis]|uniref:Major intrinsic protein n=1 Tax=Corchorus capsularis TaxID=210143 RepID=A0A1R3IUW9_COCAP|nr:Major intrinsic protein [Corchorus capsularis]
MAEISGNNANHGHGGVVLNVGGGDGSLPPPPSSASKTKDFDLGFSVPFMQKLMAEVLGTYFLIFAGCMSVVVNVNNEKVVSLPGISMVWGLAVMVLVYSVGHISGAHFNPAVTIAFATCKRFPLKQIGELAGLAVGATVLLNVMFAGPITGASMNPARSLGPAIVSNHWKGIWIYLTAPVLGAVSGAWIYNMVRYTDKPLREITKSASFLKATSRNCS